MVGLHKWNVVVNDGRMDCSDKSDKSDRTFRRKLSIAKLLDRPQAHAAIGNVAPKAQNVVLHS